MSKLFLDYTTNQNVKGHGLNEENLSLPSHVTKIGHKSGRCQLSVVDFWQIEHKE